MPRELLVISATLLFSLFMFSSRNLNSAAAFKSCPSRLVALLDELCKSGAESNVARMPRIGASTLYT
jgi:hypothetical protein